MYKEQAGGDLTTNKPESCDTTNALSESFLLSSSQMSTNTLTSSLGLDCQVVLILVGLIGSGKSTFAQALQDHYPHFRRANQDELGDRRAVERLARQSLHEGLSVCIDRTNIDERQRSTWISLARERPGTEVWVLHFDTSFEVCEERLRTRHDHPTITSHQQALEVLWRFRSQYHAPRRQEGYDRELRLAATDQQLSYTAENLRKIVQSLINSPKITQHVMLLPREGNYSSYRGDHSSYRAYHRGSSSSYRGSSGYHRSGSYQARSTNYRGASNHRGQTSTHGYKHGGSFIPSQSPYHRAVESTSYTITDRHSHSMYTAENNTMWGGQSSWQNASYPDHEKE